MKTEVEKYLFLVEILWCILGSSVFLVISYLCSSPFFQLLRFVYCQVSVGSGPPWTVNTHFLINHCIGHGKRRGTQVLLLAAYLTIQARDLEGLEGEGPLRALCWCSPEHFPACDGALRGQCYVKRCLTSQPTVGTHPGEFYIKHA